MAVNLKKELEKKGISTKAVSSLLGCSEKSAFNKINAITEFTFAEALKIGDNMFPEYTLSYLFATEPTQDSV